MEILVSECEKEEKAIISKYEGLKEKVLKCQEKKNPVSTSPSPEEDSQRELLDALALECEGEKKSLRLKCYSSQVKLGNGLEVCKVI